MQQPLLAIAAGSALAVSGLPAVFAMSILLCTAQPSDARGLGGFLEALLARGLVRGAIIAGRSNAQPQYLPKSYTPDVLTVEQLANCIKKATKLDGDRQQLEIIQTALRASQSEIDLSSQFIELQRALVDQHSKNSVDAFNALIDRHNVLVTKRKAQQDSVSALFVGFNIEVDAYNAACVKKYYADDLPDAQKLAAQQP